MLPFEKGGVVSDKILVYGTKNLRIVDTSVIPLSTRGNCQTTVYAVGEKAADLIKAGNGIAIRKRLHGCLSERVSKSMETISHPTKTRADRNSKY